MNRWDSLAKEYSLGGVVAQEKILFPKLTKHLATHGDKIQSGHDVLDIGCGGGAYAAFMHSLGANVWAYDNSEEQIAIASKNNPGPNYFVDDATNHQPERTYDHQLANMVICNLETEDQLKGFFDSAMKGAKPAGRLIITNVAPNQQRSIVTKEMIQTYPLTTREGSPFKVELRTSRGDWMGPFKNHHWSDEKVEEIANKAGWYKSGWGVMTIYDQTGTHAKYMETTFVPQNHVDAYSS